MNDSPKTRFLAFLLAVLIVALLAAVGYILWRECLYSEGAAYYDSLRNTGLMKGGSLG